MNFLVFLFQFALAWLAIGLAIYLPGRLLIRWLRLKLFPLENAAASLTAGICLFTLAYWFLSLAGFPVGLWVYVAAWLAVEAIRRFRERRQIRVSDPDEVKGSLLEYWPLGLVILAGIIIQGRFMFLTGWPSPNGVSLLAWHAHDAPWHLFNIHQLANVFPPAMPGFSGHGLRNYHLFSDLLWGGIQRLAGTDPWHLYFRVAPFVYSSLLTVGSFLAGHAWSGRKQTAYLTAVLTVFASNFGFVMPLLTGINKYFLWDSVFWVQSPFSLIFNPGVSSSFGLVMMGLWALICWLRDRNSAYLVLVALAWGVLPGFKVYPGLLLISGLLIAGLWVLVYQRNSGLLIAFLCTLPVFLAVFIPPILRAPSLVRVLPGYNLGAMLVAPDRMGLMSSDTLKLMFLEKPWLVALIMAGLALVFLIGNLGVRSLGLVPLVRNLLKPRESEPVQLLIAIVIAEALAASVLLVQSGIQWNTIQFFYYAVLLAGLPASRQYWAWGGRWRKPWPVIGAALLVATSLPGTVQALIAVRYHYDLPPAAMEGLMWIKNHAKAGQSVIRPLPDYMMSEEGWQAFIRNQERGRMTSMKAWQEDARSVTATAQAAAPNTAAATAGISPNTAAASPVPEALANTAPAASGTPPLERTDAAVVAAVTQRNTYLEDTVSAQIMGYPMEERARRVQHFYLQADAVAAREFLEKENISYVILYPGMQLPFDPAGVPLKKVFENHAMTIYKYIFLGGW